MAVNDPQERPSYEQIINRVKQYNQISLENKKLLNEAIQKEIFLNSTKIEESTFNELVEYYNNIY